MHPEIKVSGAVHFKSILYKWVLQMEYSKQNIGYEISYLYE